MHVRIANYIGIVITMIGVLGSEPDVAGPPLAGAPEP